MFLKQIPTNRAEAFEAYINSEEKVPEKARRTLAALVRPFAADYNNIVICLNKAITVHISVKTGMIRREGAEKILSALEAEARAAVAGMFSKYLGTILDAIFTAAHLTLFTVGGLDKALDEVEAEAK